AGLQPQRLGVRLRVGIAMQAHLRAARAYRIDLDAWRGHRHDDGGAAAQALGGKRDALRVVAGARGNDAAREARARQSRHLVVGAAQLEREYRLEILALDEQAVLQPLREGPRRLERRFPRHVVDPRPWGAPPLNPT